MNKNSNTFRRNERLWAKIIVWVSVAIPVVVGLLFYVSPPSQLSLPFSIKVLPKFHALLNGSVFVLLLASWYFIRQKNIKAHQTCNIIALVLSAIFLLSYVTYHSLTEPTRYGGEGVVKFIYLLLLFTHIILAAIILPMILFTFLRAFAGNYAAHRKIARYTMPLWLYVSATGVIVYLMLAPYY
ncbi:MAG: DUF420 domain-containing protein [Chitinophagales bacterium]|nr:DUF420 domain-containing protein [Bacteroidota bacterium]MCB9043036.1 DUF420 domain-containing protein [Chitinophagales bacterium]